MTIKIAIAGINGRMGRELHAAANDAPDIEVVAGLVRVRTKADIGSVPRVKRVDELPDVDAIVDFTTAASTLALAIAVADRGIPFVSGVTGLSDEQLTALRDLGTKIPIFHARNFSLGLNALLSLLPSLAQSLAGYDVEIIEAHHRYKSDAPSGTALALAEAVGSPDNHFVYGRYGVSLRQEREIGIHTIRGGGNAGEHSVLIMDDGEEIRIGHRAYGRGAFASGALKAARFLANQPPGFYGMGDMVVRHS